MKDIGQLMADARNELQARGCDKVIFFVYPIDCDTNWGAMLSYYDSGVNHRHEVRLPAGEYTNETALAAGIPRLLDWAMNNGSKIAA